MKNFLQYVHAVFTMEVESWIAGMQLEGKDFQDKIILLDGSRGHAHEAAIASANAINRIAATYEISPIFWAMELIGIKLQIAAWMQWLRYFKTETITYVKES